MLREEVEQLQEENTELKISKGEMIADLEVFPSLFSSRYHLLYVTLQTCMRSLSTILLTNRHLGMKERNPSVLRDHQIGYGEHRLPKFVNSVHQTPFLPFW
jgi:hypothetical protein